MKYFVVADIHGYYDQFMNAIKDAGFDENNPEHKLISLGDPIDRGEKPVQVLAYLNRLHASGKAILIRGNHEDLMVDMLNDYPMGHDISNGTYNSALVLAADTKHVKYISNGYARNAWDDISKAVKRNKHWEYYNANTVNYFETKSYVFVHGWVPVLVDSYWENNQRKEIYRVCSEWRKANESIWKEARWISGILMTEEGVFLSDKTIVCGHWHASAWHKKYNKAVGRNTPFISDKVIACDACTALSGFVNCIILED